MEEPGFDFFIAWLQLMDRKDPSPAMDFLRQLKDFSIPVFPIFHIPQHMESEFIYLAQFTEHLFVLFLPGMPALCCQKQSCFDTFDFSGTFHEIPGKIQQLVHIQRFLVPVEPGTECIHIREQDLIRIGKECFQAVFRSHAISLAGQPEGFLQRPWHRPGNISMMIPDPIREPIDERRFLGFLGRAQGKIRRQASLFLQFVMDFLIQGLFPGRGNTHGPPSQRAPVKRKERSISFGLSPFQDKCLLPNPCIPPGKLIMDRLQQFPFGKSHFVFCLDPGLYDKTGIGASRDFFFLDQLFILSQMWLLFFTKQQVQIAYRVRYSRKIRMPISCIPGAKGVDSFYKSMGILVGLGRKIPVQLPFAHKRA